jgi:sigma-B regulation protein RsbU (phosphoserine phosphatase)
MDADGPLRPDLLAAILAPFADLGAGFGLGVEDTTGRLIASAGPVPPAAGAARAVGPTARPAVDDPRVSNEIRSDDRVIGRVTAWGPDAAGRAVAAGVEAIAVALGVLVDERRARTAAETALLEAGAEAAAERHRRIDDELALGRTIQRSFVGLVGPDIPGYDLACHYEQAAEVGGDFFDLFRPLRRGRPLSVVVADVTGKGVAAALLMAFARPVMHAAIDNASGPVDALERANRVLRERRSSLFITALCGSLTLSTGRLRLANAGHEPPLIVRRDGSPIEPMEASGSLLGAFTSLDLVEAATELAQGDIAVFYTDGVTDARSLAGDRFEDARLLEAIEAARQGSAGDVVDSIRRAVEAFQAGMAPADDITIVAIGRRAKRVYRGRRVVQPAMG